jgi:hypothetical protein
MATAATHATPTPAPAPALSLDLPPLGVGVELVLGLEVLENPLAPTGNGVVADEGALVVYPADVEDARVV